MYEQSLDDVLGALYVRDLFGVLDRPADSVTARTLLRPVLVVPESKHADDLLAEMRAARRQLALVIDEYGGTAGIVTLENLIEALVGRIEDEPPIGAEAPPPITMAADGSLILDGLTRLEELEEIADVKLPEEVHEQVDTLGGLVMASLDRIPEVGDEVVVSGRTLRVEQLDGRRVEAVRLCSLHRAARPIGSRTATARASSARPREDHGRRPQGQCTWSLLDALAGRIEDRFGDQRPQVIDVVRLLEHGTNAELPGRWERDGADGDDDHGDVPGVAPPRSLGQETVPVPVGHQDVQGDDVRVPVAKDHERLLAAPHAANLVACNFEDGESASS